MHVLKRFRKLVVFDNYNPKQNIFLQLADVEFDSIILMREFFDYVLIQEYLATTLLFNRVLFGCVIIVQNDLRSVAVEVFLVELNQTIVIDDDRPTFRVFNSFWVDTDDTRINCEYLIEDFGEFHLNRVSSLKMFRREHVLLMFIG